MLSTIPEILKYPIYSLSNTFFGLPEASQALGMVKEGKILLPAITKDRVYPQKNDPK